ncbi:MAG TPA: exodeoxyribonuclease VII large subunit, partial [Firmicutes bacterium]|nr:exodeoxyribonuclease VII large subunit [Bacillota bacterium]
LGKKMERLNALSPLAVLNRGYSICHREDDGKLVRNAQDVIPGERVAITLRHGQLHAKVVAHAG